MMKFTSTTAAPASRVAPFDSWIVTGSWQSPRYLASEW